MVAGWRGLTGTLSTEILVSGSNSWVTISPFTTGAIGLKSVNYKNTILAFGNLSLTFIMVITFFSMKDLRMIFTSLTRLMKLGIPLDLWHIPEIAMQ